MDPNLFHLKWDQSFEILAAIVIISIVIERALSVFFENRRLIKSFDGNGSKEFVALGVSIAVCLYWQIDVPSVVLSAEKVSVPGMLLTAAMVAGGSKGSIKLFRDVLQFHSTAWAEYERGDKKPENPPPSDKKPENPPPPDSSASNPA